MRLGASPNRQRNLAFVKFRSSNRLLVGDGEMPAREGGAMPTRYRVVFHLTGVCIGQKEVVVIAGPHEMKEGFWVDESLEYTVGIDNNKYFVPPSAILYIEKLPKLVKVTKKQWQGISKDYKGVNKDGSKSCFAGCITNGAKGGTTLVSEGVFFEIVDNEEGGKCGN